MSYHEGSLLTTANGYLILCECGHKTATYQTTTNAHTVHHYHQKDNQ